VEVESAGIRWQAATTATHQVAVLDSPARSSAPSIAGVSPTPPPVGLSPESDTTTSPAAGSSLAASSRARAWSSGHHARLFRSATTHSKHRREKGLSKILSLRLSISTHGQNRHTAIESGVPDSTANWKSARLPHITEAIRSASSSQAAALVPVPPPPPGHRHRQATEPRDDSIITAARSMHTLGAWAMEWPLTGAQHGGSSAWLVRPFCCFVFCERACVRACVRVSAAGPCKSSACRR
jgi:hypothetical protein